MRDTKISTKAATNEPKTIKQKFTKSDQRVYTSAEVFILSKKPGKIILQILPSIA